MPRARSRALALALLAGCPPVATTQLELYDVELREKVNTCRELDPQVSKEVIFIERYGRTGVLHLGAERAFPVDISADGRRAVSCYVDMIRPEANTHVHLWDADTGRPVDK